MSGVNPKKNIFSEPHKKNVEELKRRYPKELCTI